MILSALSSAALRCVGQSPNAFYSSSDQIAREFSSLANEVAADIAKGNDWRDLTRIATFTGDGVTEAFAKPSDYDRMLGGAEVDDAATWFWGYSPFGSVNDWMRFRGGASGLAAPGGWIILGGQFHFWPAPAGDARFPYIRNTWAIGADASHKAAFDADDDTFALPERLLTLGLIWRWRAWKGLEYGEDMRNFEIALAQEIGRDKGARVVSSPRGLRAQTAYPWALGPGYP